LVISVGCYQKLLILLSIIVVPTLAYLLCYNVLFKTPSSPDISPPTALPAVRTQLDLPSMQDLLSLSCENEELKIITHVASECYTFGIHLDLDKDEVKNELLVTGGQVKSKCQNIMNLWLDGAGKKGKEGKSVSWETLIGALRKLGKNSMADNLDRCIK